MEIIDRSIKPEESGKISFTLPKIEKFKLENGLEVYFIRKNKLPIIQLNLITNAGSVFDPVGKKGTANLFSMVVDEGAGDYDALSLSDEFDRLGSHFSVYSTQDSIYFSLQSLTENLERSLELFETVLTKPHFNMQDFEREQRKVLTRIIQLKDEPDEIADSVFENILLGKENPYGSRTIGYEEDIKNISVDDLKKFGSNYIHPNNAALVVVGDANLEELKQQLNIILKDWKPFAAVNQISIKRKENSPKIYIVNKKDSVQTEIRIGHFSSKRNEGNYFAKTILNTILGGQFTSRINLNLREKKGYTYGAHSQFNYYKNEAFFYVTTSVGNENTGNAVKEIFNELQKIKHGVLQSELDFAKSALIRKFPSNFETYKQIANNLTGMILHSLSEKYFNTYLQNVEDISINDVNNAAAKYILPEKAVTVLIGEKDKIISQINELNFGEAIEVDEVGNSIHV
jgi:zinc protease